MPQVEQNFSTQCLNCEADLAGPFCAQCGQKAGPSGVSLRYLIGQLIGETFELDGRVPRTMLHFLFKPGLLTLEYMAGRRRMYTAPLRLFLAMGALWVVVMFSLTQYRTFYPSQAQIEAEAKSPEVERERAEREAEREASGEPGWTLLDASGFWGETPQRRIILDRSNRFMELSKLERNKRLQEAMKAVVPTLAFALLPVFAFVLRLLTLGSGRMLPEHVIFALHIHALELLILVVYSGLELMGVPADAIWLCVGLWFGSYVFLALRRNYALSWWGTTWRWIVLSALFFFFSSISLSIGMFATAIS